MGHVSDLFTWRRGRNRDGLDRGLVNDGWASLFPHAALENLQFNHSDHRPLLVNTEYYAGERPIQTVPKRFEARWPREEFFSELVQTAWENVGADHTINGIYDKLSRMHSQFHDWDQRVLKKPKKRLRKAQRELEAAMSGPMNDENEERRKELAELVKYLLELEEIQCMQRSRVNWLKFGDRNTAFFQTFRVVRQKKNYIKKIKRCEW